MNTVKVLASARKIIEDPAWWHGGGHRCGNGHCTSTAISEAVWRDQRSHVGERDLLKLFAVANDIPYESPMSIWRWNDALDRKHADVMAAFDRAIEHAAP